MCAGKGTLSLRLSSRASSWASLFLVAVMMTTLTPIASAQSSEQNLKLRLIAELASIESELAELRQSWRTQGIELSDYRERSTVLSQRLTAAEQRLERLLPELDELRNTVSRLQIELATLQNEFDESERAWNAERTELTRQIDEVADERDQAVRGRSRQRWIGRLEGVAAALALIGAAVGIRTLAR